MEIIRPKAMLPEPSSEVCCTCLLTVCPHGEEKNRIRERVKNAKDILSKILSKGEV